MSNSNWFETDGKKTVQVKKVEVWNKDTVISSLASRLNAGVVEILKQMTREEIERVQGCLEMSQGLFMAEFLEHIFESPEKKKRREAQISDAATYKALAQQELDLERLLYITLNFLLEKVGQTNAAIFLPITADEYTLGAYVDYSLDKNNPEILLNSLADVFAPRIGEMENVLHFTDDESLADWQGDDSSIPEGNHLLGVRCLSEGEVLAVIILFRHGEKPYTRTAIESLEVIVPLFTECLAKVVRVHHRHMHN